MSGPLREVGRVDGRILLGHDDVVAARHGVRPFLEPQLFAVKDDRVHRSTVCDGARMVHRMRIALAQVDSRLGDLDANTRRARQAVSDARAGGADLVVFPELQMSGYDTALGRMAVLICNDAWQPFLPSLAVHDGAEILLMPACSSTAVREAEPYWRELTRFHAKMLECFVVFVNRVGDEEGFTYWGGSHVVDPWGEVVAEAPRHEEALVFADVDLERVAARRSELPLVGDPRLDLLRAELARLETAETTTRRSP